MYYCYIIIEFIILQILASVVAFMLVTQPGINMVYSNIFLNHYKSTDVSELSWLSKFLAINHKLFIIPKFKLAVHQ